MARASSGTTLARVPPADHADGDGDATVEILQIVDGRDLPRQLAHRADALTGIEPGMRRHAARDQLELADALAARLQRAARQRRLEHQHRLAVRRFGFDQRARRGAADLLVRRPQHHRLAVSRPPARSRARVASVARRDARLHVEHAGPVQAPAVARDRHSSQLPDRPHRVEVAEQQHLSRAAAEAGAQVIAGGRRLGSRDELPPSASSRARQLRTTAIDGRRIVAWRFDGDERFDELEQPVVTREAVVEEI